MFTDPVRFLNAAAAALGTIPIHDEEGYPTFSMSVNLHPSTREQFDQMLVHLTDLLSPGERSEDHGWIEFKSGAGCSVTLFDSHERQNELRRAALAAEKSEI